MTRTRMFATTVARRDTNTKKTYGGVAYGSGAEGLGFCTLDPKPYNFSGQPMEVGFRV